MQSPERQDADRTTAVVLNRQSGTVRSMGEEMAQGLLRDAFGPEVDIRMVHGSEVKAEVGCLLAEGRCRRIIVGGGDGTVASVAGLLAGTGVSMGILPFGTMNLMAKTAGMSTDLAEALAQLQLAEPRQVDAARVGERLFLHHVSIGLQPRIVRIREKIGYSSRLTKMLASARAFANVLLNPRSQRLSLEIDGRPVEVRTPALLVSNNIYEDSAWLMQARLDEGLLGVYALKPMSRISLLGLALDLLRGRWRDNLNVGEEHARSVRITFCRRRFGRRRRSVRATIDGELSVLELPLTITSEPGALSLMVPPKHGA